MLMFRFPKRCHRFLFLFVPIYRNLITTNSYVFPLQCHNIKAIVMLGTDLHKMTLSNNPYVSPRLFQETKQFLVINNYVVCKSTLTSAS